MKQGKQNSKNATTKAISSYNLFGRVISGKAISSNVLEMGIIALIFNCVASHVLGYHGYRICQLLN